MKKMPYKSINELPPAIRKLPPGAQKIYKEVFNASFNGDDGKAAQIAWGAVKKSYIKEDNQWVKK